jgi:Na+-translocating ferredoxin:NAD+ oxidoreductase RnfG subunit
MKTKKRMNFWAFSLALMIGLLVSSCSDMSNAKIDLSANEQQKEEAFNQILNNQELLNDFMNEMMAQPTSMNYMMENGQFMNHMFNQKNLDYMREHNPEIDNHMMNNMMYMMDRDTSIAKEWDIRMHKRNPMNQ